MSEIKLKPCPFCGSADNIVVTNREYGRTERVYEGLVACVKCHVHLASDELYKDEVSAEIAAVKAWNWRVGA